MNEAIATAGSNALVLDTAEEALSREVSIYEAEALRMVVASDEDFARAGEALKEVKRMQKKVTEYWEPLRVSAKKNYDVVLAHKKEMMNCLRPQRVSLQMTASKIKLQAS